MDASQASGELRGLITEAGITYPEVWSMTKATRNVAAAVLPPSLIVNVSQSILGGATIDVGLIAVTLSVCQITIR